MCQAQMAWHDASSALAGDCKEPHRALALVLNMEPTGRVVRCPAGAALVCQRGCSPETPSATRAGSQSQP